MCLCKCICVCSENGRSDLFLPGEEKLYRPDKNASCGGGIVGLLFLKAYTSLAWPSPVEPQLCRTCAWQVCLLFKCIEPR